MVSGKDALHWTSTAETNDERLADRLADHPFAVVHPDDVVARAVDLMLGRHQGCVAVADPDTGRLVGIVTRRDLLKVRAEVVRSEDERRAFLTRRNPLRDPSARAGCVRAPFGVS